MKKLYVDVGCRHNPGPYEIQGVIDGRKVFYEKFALGSNNIGEYLALYWGVFMYPDYEVWTDSVTAITWATKGKHNTKVPVDARTDKGLRMANKFFTENPWVFKNIKFWNTETLGDIPADFGRKGKRKSGLW